MRHKLFYLLIRLKTITCVNAACSPKLLAKVESLLWAWRSTCSNVLSKLPHRLAPSSDGVYLVLLFWFAPAWALKIDRVILATDDHPNYIQFWPLVAQVWQNMGIRPTLALIGDQDVKVDTSFGDVIRFEPILDMPTWFYAQNIRLLLPAYFPDDVCIISDIDMLPLKRSYFVDNMAKVVNPKALVVFRDHKSCTRYPMCYLAAKGSVFQDLFQLNRIADIPATITEWYNFNIGWETDEILFYQAVLHWPKANQDLVKLGLGGSNRTRICRSNWNYNLAELKSGLYVDAHLPRPYDQFEDQIDRLIKELDLLGSVQNV